MSVIKERPILFSGPIIFAILQGGKTVTGQPFKFPFIDNEFGCELAGHEIGSEDVRSNCPYGAPGQRLWLRETSRYLPLRPSLANCGRRLSPTGS